ncbi:hypothetical protein C7G68_19165, partial [Acinetobacter baumannii]
GVTVQVLAADRDTDDQVRKGGAVGGNGGLESGQLIGNGGITARDPETQQKSGLSGNGSRDGRDDAVGSAPFNHGVETGTVPAAGARQVLGTVELGLEVGLGQGLLVEEEGTIVETLDTRVGSAGGSLAAGLDARRGGARGGSGSRGRGDAAGGGIVGGSATGEGAIAI